MRLSLWRNFPYVYLAENSTGKKIDDFIPDKLLEKPQIKSAFNRHTEHDLGLRHDGWDNTSLTVEYDHHILIKRLGSAIRTFSKYHEYLDADEDAKQSFADYVAQKIADWMADHFTQEHMQVNQQEEWSLRGLLNYPKLQFSVILKPPLPEDNDLPDIFRTIRFDFSNCLEISGSSSFFDY